MRERSFVASRCLGVLHSKSVSKKMASVMVIAAYVKNALRQREDDGERERKENESALISSH